MISGLTIGKPLLFWTSVHVFSVIIFHDFQFIVSLVVTRAVLDRTLPATKLLQTKNADIIDGIDIVSSLKDLAHSMLVDAREYHNDWYSRALKLAEQVNIQESKRRTCIRQVHRSNPNYDTIPDYYFKTVTVELLAHLCNQLEIRFDSSSMISYQGISIVPSKLISSFYSNNNINWRESFRCFVNFYEDDFPKLQVLKGELDAWERFWVAYKKSHPNTVLQTLKIMSPFADSFPDIHIALRLLATLPITSCECERSFSAMKKLKNYTRSTMTGERLDGIALMYIHFNIDLDLKEVIRIFALMGPRRNSISLKIQHSL